MQYSAQHSTTLPLQRVRPPQSRDAMFALRSCAKQGCVTHARPSSADLGCPGMQKNKATRYALDYLYPGNQLPLAGASDVIPTATTHDLAGGTVRGGPHIPGAAGRVAACVGLQSQHRVQLLYLCMTLQAWLDTVVRQRRRRLLLFIYMNRRCVQGTADLYQLLQMHPNRSSSQGC